MYMSKAVGPKPYNTKVKIAPRIDPLVLLASATAIMSATYSQPMAMRYIEVPVELGTP
jgi:hypothetical protein